MSGRSFLRCCRLSPVLLRRALAAALLWACVPGSADAAELAADWPVGPAANLTATAEARVARAEGVGEGCGKINGAERGGAQLTCGAALVSGPREVKIERGEFSWSLGLAGGTAREIGAVRGQLGFNHPLGLGPLGGWLLRTEIAIDRPTGAAAGVPIAEHAQFWLRRALPGGWTLQLGASATAQGALNPVDALDQRSEVAALLSRNFRLDQRDHTLSLRLARDTGPHGSRTGQQPSLAGLEYTYKLELGAVTANVAFSRVKPADAPVQEGARAGIRYARRF